MNKTQIKPTQIIDAMIDQYESLDAGDAALIERITDALADIHVYRCYYNDTAGYRHLMDEASANWLATEAEAQACCREQNALHPDEDEDTRYYAAQHGWSGDIDTDIEDYRQASGHLGAKVIDGIIASTVQARETRKRRQAKECDRVQTILDKRVAERAKEAQAAKAIDKPLDMQ